MFCSCKKTETLPAPTTLVEANSVPQYKIDLIRNWTNHLLDSARKNGYKAGTPGSELIRLQLSSIRPALSNIPNALNLYSYWNGKHHMLWLDGNTENRANYIAQEFLGTADPVSYVGNLNVSPHIRTYYTPIYRFYNRITGAHLFTADENEAAAIIQHGGYGAWNSEGYECAAVQGVTSGTLVYRYHKTSGSEDYYYHTSSPNIPGYRAEGLAWGYAAN